MPVPRQRSTNIRPAIAGDTDFILSLAPRFVGFDLPRGRRKRDVVAALREDLEHALREKPAKDHFFIAVGADGRSTGFLHLQVQRDFFSSERTCHVSDIAVAAGHEGQGIGRMLLERAQRWAREIDALMRTAGGTSSRRLGLDFFNQASTRALEALGISLVDVDEAIEAEGNA